MMVASSSTQAGQATRQLLEADRQLSASTLAEFLANDGVVFPLSGHPIQGRQALARASIPDVPHSPQIALLSTDRSIGYTSGSYDLDGKTGYYGIAWIKESGSWRVAVAMGFPVSIDLHSNPEPPAQPDFAPHTGEVVRTERQFATYARRHGVPFAFFKFMAANGIALSSSGPPRHRADYQSLARQATPNDAPPTDLLEWGPIRSRISGSGDLAYNYGPYRYSYRDKTGKKQTAYGYFFTIWQLQSGSWKFLFDGGNTCQKLSDQFLKEIIHHDD